eukprot:4017440-Amphidinium_carterae.1
MSCYDGSRLGVHSKHFKQSAQKLTLTCTSVANECSDRGSSQVQKQKCRNKNQNPFRAHTQTHELFT